MMVRHVFLPVIHTLQYQFWIIFLEIPRLDIFKRKVKLIDRTCFDFFFPFASFSCLELVTVLPIFCSVILHIGTQSSNILWRVSFLQLLVAFRKSYSWLKDTERTQLFHEILSEHAVVVLIVSSYQSYWDVIMSFIFFLTDNFSNRRHRLSETPCNC